MSLKERRARQGERGLENAFVLRPVTSRLQSESGLRRDSSLESCDIACYRVFVSFNLVTVFLDMDNWCESSLFTILVILSLALESCMIQSCIFWTWTTDVKMLCLLSLSCHSALSVIHDSIVKPRGTRVTAFVRVFLAWMHLLIEDLASSFQETHKP